MTNLAIAIELFNQQDFHGSHDLLEEMWIDAYGLDQTFYRGLLQIAVGFYHLGDRNWRGSAILLGEGISSLRDYQPEYANINVSQLIQDSAALLKILQTTEPQNLAAMDFVIPQILRHR